MGTPDHADAAPGARRARVHAGLVLAIGLGLAVCFSALGFIRSSLFAPPVLVRPILVEALSRWLLYAALAPAVGWCVARWPLARGRRGRRWLAHLLAMAACAFTHVVLVACVYGLLHIYPAGSTLAEAIGRLAVVYFGVNLVIFGAIDGAYHAVRYHHEALAREQLAAELRARLAAAQLDSLRAQLNPHFLFNTLNAISGLALSGEGERVAETLSVLSDLLRVSLDPHLPQEIPLSRELEFLRGYLEIQRIRFGDRLQLDVLAAPGALAALLPSLVLQPLVENAIQHGIAARPGPGRVVIRAEVHAARLCVRVEDDGPGFAAGSPAAGGHGIGLENTRARLGELHGAAGMLTCTNGPRGGACVELSVPLRTLDAEGQSA